MTQQWAAEEVTQRQVQELIPYDRNPRVHSDKQIDQIKNSIQEWGWTVPLIIDENDNVVAGHGRLYAAQSLGIEKVPCVVARGWTDAQKRAYVIADNQIAENSHWDPAIFHQELKRISSEGFDMNLMGIENFANHDFQPSLNPVSDYSGVSERDFERAAGNLQDRIDSISADKASQGTEVMCPHCANTFKFIGY